MRKCGVNKLFNWLHFPQSSCLAQCGIHVWNSQTNCMIWTKKNVVGKRNTCKLYRQIWILRMVPGNHSSLLRLLLSIYKIKQHVSPETHHSDPLTSFGRVQQHQSILLVWGGKLCCFPLHHHHTPQPVKQTTQLTSYTWLLNQYICETVLYYSSSGWYKWSMCSFVGLSLFRFKSIIVVRLHCPFNKGMAELETPDTKYKRMPLQVLSWSICTYIQIKNILVHLHSYSWGFEICTVLNMCSHKNTPNFAYGLDSRSPSISPVPPPLLYFSVWLFKLPHFLISNVLDTFNSHLLRQCQALLHYLCNAFTVNEEQQMHTINCQKHIRFTLTIANECGFKRVFDKYMVGITGGNR